MQAFKASLIFSSMACKNFKQYVMNAIEQQQKYLVYTACCLLLYDD